MGEQARERASGCDGGSGSGSKSERETERERERTHLAQECVDGAERLAALLPQLLLALALARGVALPVLAHEHAGALHGVEARALLGHEARHVLEQLLPGELRRQLRRRFRGGRQADGRGGGGRGNVDGVA